MQIDERYSAACNAANLRVTAEKNGNGDVLIAAGWSKSQLGAALMRLRSEWDSVARPRKVTPEAISQVARTMQGLPGEKLAKAQRIAADWYAHELRLMAQRLQTLPAIRASVSTWLARPGGHDIASTVLMHWLDPICTGCSGQKWELIPNTPAQSTKACKVCRASGTIPAPYGETGRNLENYLDDCVNRAKSSMTLRLKNRA